MEELLAHFALFSQQDDDTQKDVVRVMTIHTAKGLEFDTVFVNGMVEGQFPSKRLRNEDEYEEERRLFYVAITRAKKMLYISSYDTKAASFAAKASSFLEDIAPGLLECINQCPATRGEQPREMLPKTTFVIGDRVVHKVFGEGKIIGIDEKALCYEIQFVKLRGSRKILFRAELKKRE